MAQFFQAVKESGILTDEQYKKVILVDPMYLSV